MADCLKAVAMDFSLSKRNNQSERFPRFIFTNGTVTADQPVLWPHRRRKKGISILPYLPSHSSRGRP